ncbi:MAG: hypothetical protein Tsb009_01620 [Planctomycetaceae bacterium]
MNCRVFPSIVIVLVFSVFSIAAPDVHAADSPKKTSDSATSAGKSLDPLDKQVLKAIEVTKLRFLTANVHTPWQIMHGLLALRKDYLIKDPKGKKIRAVDFISQGPTFQGDSWFQVTSDGGRAHPYSTDYAFEGHANQFLAILSITGLPTSHQLKADRGTITIADMVKHAKANLTSNDEVTWTLWALSHYLGPDATWRSKYGEQWSIERLVQMQTREQPYNAACGGSHGMFALTYARNVYLRKNRKLRGVWLAADQKIQRYIAEAKALQNPDGTFSTEYFQGRGFSNNFEKRLNTTGHTLEFLMIALPKKRLKEAWVRKAIKALASDLIENKYKPAKCASLYHALNGLILYRDRMIPMPKLPVAARKPKHWKSSSVRLSKKNHKPGGASANE